MYPLPPHIAPHIAQDIQERLSAIEAEHGVHILYACESGSRGWGFASPDSDYDVRFLYVHPLAWYLQVTAQRDVIEMPISQDLDINGWELRKSLALLKKGNATLIEWLQSPIVYRADTAFLSQIKAAAHATHQADRSFHHYFHMARRNYRDYLRGDLVRLKKYLYVLRPLLAALWIEQERGVVPMLFQDLVEAIITDAALREDIEHLLSIKRAASEADYGASLPRINDFLDAELSRLEAMPQPLQPEKDFSILDCLLKQTVLAVERSAAPDDLRAPEMT